MTCESHFQQDSHFLQDLAEKVIQCREGTTGTSRDLEVIQVKVMRFRKFEYDLDHLIVRLKSAWQIEVDYILMKDD